MAIKVSYKDSLASFEQIKISYFETMREFGKWKAKQNSIRILDVEKVKRGNGNDKNIQ